jgi:putative Mg2+ transporter-C (MgtC) family protein
LVAGERLAVAMVCGVAIGVNRHLHGKPAGIRTHACVAIGAALFTVIAVTAGAADTSGVARTLQGIATGIGFLGAGVILHPAGRKNVQGLTTAATIWVTAGLGAACGIGLYGIAFVTIVLMFVVLIIGGAIEHRLDRIMAARENAASLVDGS